LRVEELRSDLAGFAKSMVRSILEVAAEWPE